MAHKAMHPFLNSDFYGKHSLIINKIRFIYSENSLFLVESSKLHLDGQKNHRKQPTLSLC